MKFRRLIGLLVFAVVVAAFFSNPEKTDFMKFIADRPSSQTTAPTVDYTSHFLYSQAEVTYFTPVHQQGRQVAIASKAKYIGVFGRFWKQDN